MNHSATVVHIIQITLVLYIDKLGFVLVFDGESWFLIVVVGFMLLDHVVMVIGGREGGQLANRVNGSCRLNGDDLVDVDVVLGVLVIYTGNHC